MPQKDSYEQSIVFLILLFLIGSALVVAHNDATRARSLKYPAEALTRHGLTLPFSYQTIEMHDAGVWHPVIMVKNLGTSEALIEVTTYDAGGTELPRAFAEDHTISIPSGKSAIIPLPGMESLPYGEYSFALSSNQPITGTVMNQTTSDERQNSGL